MPNYLRHLIPAVMLLLTCHTGTAQSWFNPRNNEPENAKKFSELTIPSSSAFDLLQMNPSLVNQPNVIRDFKVDWSFKSYKLSPNLAIQAQPFWEAFFNRDNLYRYQNASWMMKTLSTFDVSAGTVEDEWSNRKLAYAAKINLYRSYDAWDTDDEFTDAVDDYYSERRTIDSLLELYTAQYDSIANQDSIPAAEKKELKRNIEDAKELLDEIKTRHNEKLKNIVKSKAAANWNASFVDVAYGRSLTYANITTSSVKKNGDQYAVWVNASLGIGRKILLSSLLRYGFQNRSVVPSRADTASVTQETLGMGVNARYGNERVSFFTEYFYEEGSDDTGNALRTSIVGYGGNWRFSSNVILNFALRTFYNSKGQLTNLTPFISISCMMR